MTSNIISNAINFAQQNSINLPLDLILDGRIKRFSSDHSKKQKKDEWYVGHELDNHIVIVFGSWRDDKKHVYRSWSDNQEPDPRALELLRQAREAAEQETVRVNAEARKKAESIWNEAEDCLWHPYLERKGVKPFGLKVFKNHLVLPIYSAETDHLISLQFISAEGDKKFLSGSTTKGGYFLIGDPNQKKDAYLAEGYATACSAYEATGSPCLVAYSASNAARTAKLLQHTNKFQSIHLLQDLGSAGETEANKWKEHKIGEVYVPKWKDKPSQSKDFNDLHKDEGLDVVKQQIKLKKFKLYSFEETLFMKVNENKFVIENMIDSGSMNVLYAQSGVGKSMLALDLAFAISMGKKVFYGKQCAKQSVLVIDGELTMHDLKTRFNMCANRWKPHLEADDDGTFNVLSWTSVYEEHQENLNLYNPVHRHILDSNIEDHDFIVLDNLDSLSERSSTDDNFRSDDKDWKILFRWIRKWTEKGKTFLIVMHTTKQQQLKGTCRIKQDASTIIRLDKINSDKTGMPNNLCVLVSIEKGRSLQEKHKKPFAAAMINEDENTYCRFLPWKVLKSSEMKASLNDYKANEVDWTKFF